MNRSSGNVDVPCVLRKQHVRTMLVSVNLAHASSTPPFQGLLVDFEPDISDMDGSEWFQDYQTTLDDSNVTNILAT